MSQLPLIPSIQEAKALTQPTESSAVSQTLDVEGQAESSTFGEAMQAVLESPESDFFPGLVWTAALPMEPEMISQPLFNGNVMPGQSTPGGNPLPFQFAETFSNELEVIKPGVGAESPNGFLVQKLIGQADRNTLPSVSASFSEGMIQALESRSGGELTGQVNLTAVPTLNSALPGRAAPPAALPVDVPVGQPGWDKAVGERIQWMVGRDIQNAEVKLTPPHLGPMEIRISVQNDQASVSFVAAQQPTRDALEASIPRLREMLGEANLNLVNVGVGHGGGSDSDSTRHSDSGGEMHAGSGKQEATAPDPQGTMLNRLVSEGIVDDYA